jgi:hypothetical protein
MTTTSPGFASQQVLRACLDRVVTEAGRMRTTLPQLNQVDPGLESRINLLLTVVERTIAEHLDEPGDGLADDIESLRSATRQLRVPAEEPGLGETFALRELGAAQGRMLNAVLDAQEEARAQGLRPMAGSVGMELGIDVPRAGNEDVLRDIGARLDEVVERLDQLQQARTEDSSFRAEGRLLDFYIGKMRVQVDLARLQLRIGERTVDFSALWRATQGMSDLTQGFIETVTAWVGRTSASVTRLATEIGLRVRGVANGMRGAIRTILRRRHPAKPAGLDVQSAEPLQLRAPVEPPVGFDLTLVKEMILAGRSPPLEWCPFITELKLGPETRLGTQEQLLDLSPLAVLTALRSLDLGDTRVSDLTPLRELTTLEVLDLAGTDVRDIRPLTGLTALQSLDLTATPVKDVAPLGRLEALYSLNLWGTRISDVMPLRTLSKLQFLNLRATRVGDVTWLGELTELRALYLWGTAVGDVAPLGALAALQFLDLSGTRVTDVTPLASLKQLKRLDLTGTWPVGINVLRRSDLEIIGGTGSDLERTYIRRRVTRSTIPRRPPQ